jgi:ribonucleoside-diphosphate reductase beta chain
MMIEKFLLKGSESFNLAPYKYPWAATMVEKSIHNTWFAPEINMTQDKACYEHSLTADERHMFMMVFASLTTADAAIAENLCIRFYEMFKAAEIRYYLERQIAEEGVHRHAYQHCLEVLGVDQEEVYNMYRTKPHIKQWFDCINSMTSAPDVLLQIASFSGLVEGVWFPTAFAAIYSLLRRNLMIGAATQIRMIHRDESTHTAFGMKLFGECAAELGSKPHVDDVHSLFSRAMESMDEWADYCIPSTILGYNPEAHKQHTRYLADRRLRQMGYSKLFHAEETMPWLDAMSSIKAEENFFERAVTAYSSAAALKFEENDSMSDIANWR